MFRIIILISFSVISITGWGQSSNELTLRECVEIALDKNLSLRRNIYNVESFEIGLRQSKAAFLPTLSGNSSYGFNTGRSINPVTNTFVTRETSNLNLGLNSSMSLFNGFRLQNSFRQSRTDLEASNYDLEKVRNDVIINVVTLYTNVILSKELYENSSFQLVSSQEQLSNIEKQVAAGALPRSNELDQQATVATNELNLVNQENALNLSLLQLKQALQMPASQPLEVVVPELTLDDMVIEETAEEIYAISMEALPQTKSAALKVESAEYALKVAKGNYYPSLSLSGSARTNYASASRSLLANEPDGTFAQQQVGYVGGTGETVYRDVPGTTQSTILYGVGDQLSDNISKGVSLGLNIPLFNGLQTRSAVQRAVISKELAAISLQETQNTLRQTIESAYNDAVSASKSYESTLKQVEAREEAYRMNQQRFDNGAISYVDYVVSENNLFQARSSLAQAKFRFLLTKRVLDFYMGKPIEY